MAAGSGSTSTTTTRDVLLYIPNLIGYFRVLCTLSGLVLMVLVTSVDASPSSNSGGWWILAISLYLGSFVGDLFDGMAARRFQQTSVYGGLLDMVTDRCSTAGLLYILDGEYSRYYYEHEDHNYYILGLLLPISAVYRLLFLGLILLDISSHWCQMFSTASVVGAHHKSSEGNRGSFFLVRWYYQSYPFFGYCCVGAEFTYMILYVLRHLNATTTATAITQGLLVLCVPACFVKQVVNITQLCSACFVVATRDAEKRNMSCKREM